MNQPTFNYVEDYMEFIAGLRDISGRKLGIFDTVPSPISLARYDVQIVNSMADQTLGGKAYTDKQSELAKKIVTKYRKQLSQLAVPVYLPEQVTKFRLGIRQIDRSKNIKLIDNKFEIKFPFDTKLIEAIKKQASLGQGTVEFNSDIRVWYMALTESNLNWIIAISEIYQFNIDSGVLELYDKLMAVEKQEYKIELIENAQGFEITNAARSLIDYIQNRLGGFGPDNFLMLVDNSQVLGYEISLPLLQRLKNEYRQFYFLIKNRKLKRNKKNTTLEQLLEYARVVNRLPVYIYDTGLPKVDSDEIKYLSANKPIDIVPKLIISHSDLMIGSKKQSWLTNAEKVFYLTE
jgi:hypothetical protein